MYDKKIDAGDNSNNTIGNNNTNLYQKGTFYNVSLQESSMFVPGTKEIQESEIYKICCIIADTPLIKETNLDVSKNADWFKKIHFNDLKKYREKFEMYMPYYGVIETVLSSSDINGESVIRNIKSLYLDIKYSDNVPTSDKIIDIVYSQLNDIVKESVPQLTFTLESLNDSLHLIIFYAFTFCQILEIPPDDYEFTL